MKWLLPVLILWVSFTAITYGDDTLRREIRKIRRAYLDVTELLPTQEEIDWYIVYNKDGYPLAVDFLVPKAQNPTWTKQHLISNEYLTLPEELIDRPTLDKNVVYLAGLWKGEMSESLKEAGAEKFIKDALLASDEKTADAIEYMINQLTCRPSTATEENEFIDIYNKVSLKEDEMSAWKTVLLHILEMHDCKYK